MKSPIVYYSHSGNIRRLAELIAKETHEGGGSGHICQDMEKASRSKLFLPELSIYSDSGRVADVQKWLKKINFTK